MKKASKKLNLLRNFSFFTAKKTLCKYLFFSLFYSEISFLIFLFKAYLNLHLFN